MRARLLRRVTLGFVLAFASAPLARGADAPAVGRYDLGLQTGYMFGVTNNAQAVTFLPRAGRIMWVGTGEHPGVVSFGVEGLFTHYYQTNSAMDLGGGPYLRWRMVRDWVQPYAEVGVGMLYNDLKTFSLSSRVLFSVNGAVGVEVPVAERWGVTMGYRFRHISNAGQDAINPGLNANVLAVGVTFTY